MPLAESIRDELVKVFTVPQADVLASCVVRAHDTLATRSDMHELRVAMTELAEQEKKTGLLVSELAEQQKETSKEVRALAEQQKETSKEVRALAEQQKQTSKEVRELAEQQKQTSKEVKELAGIVRTLSIRTDATAGWALEWLVGKHLPAYVGRKIRRCRIIGIMDLVEPLEDDPTTCLLTADEIDELRRSDLVATGTIDGGSIYLVGEVSYTADNDDVLRAARRAALLQKAGHQAQAFVACDQINPIPAEMARRDGVWVIRKGRLLEPAA
jgi:hypothetical protein